MGSKEDIYRTFNWFNNGYHWLSGRQSIVRELSPMCLCAYWVIGFFFNPVILTTKCIWNYYIIVFNQTMIFYQAAPSHLVQPVGKFVDINFFDNWVGKTVHFEWLSRSPDFFSRSYLKTFQITNFSMFNRTVHFHIMWPPVLFISKIYFAIDG